MHFILMEDVSLLVNITSYYKIWPIDFLTACDLGFLGIHTVYDFVGEWWRERKNKLHHIQVSKSWLYY